MNPSQNDPIPSRIDVPSGGPVTLGGWSFVEIGGGRDPETGEHFRLLTGVAGVRGIPGGPDMALVSAYLVRTIRDVRDRDLRGLPRPDHVRALDDPAHGTGIIVHDLRGLARRTGRSR